MVDIGQAREEWLVKTGLAKVIVFDLDGTLVDSDYANFLAYEDAVTHVLSKHIKLDFSQSIRITRESLKELIPNITDKQLNDISSHKERIYHKYLSKTKVNSIGLTQKPWKQTDCAVPGAGSPITGLV